VFALVYAERCDLEAMIITRLAGFTVAAQYHASPGLGRRIDSRTVVDLRQGSLETLDVQVQALEKEAREPRFQFVGARRLGAEVVVATAGFDCAAHLLGVPPSLVTLGFRSLIGSTTERKDDAGEPANALGLAVSHPS